MPPIDLTALDDDPLLPKVWLGLGRPAGWLAVGGYVRDRLLGSTSADLDLSAEGDEDACEAPVRRLAMQLGGRAHPLGRAPHRIWRIDAHRLKIEIWPRRRLSRDDDLRRRDFGCNALGYSLPDGPLIDRVGGLDDLRSGRLRAIARDNLERDPVRLIRAARFLTQLPTFDLDPETGTWIRDLAPRLAGAPRERIGAELLALLRGPAAARGLRACLDLGAIRPSAPVAYRVDTVWLAENIGTIDRLNTRRLPDDPAAPSAIEAARLAFLFRAWGLPASRDLAAYAWPAGIRNDALRAARMLDDVLDIVDQPAPERRELAWRAGAAFPALIDLAAAIAPDRSGWRRWRRQWRRNREALLHPRPLLTGDEIAELTGIEPGPALGAVADALLRAQVRGEVRTRGGAVARLRRA